MTMRSDSLRTLAVTSGDPAGIGPDIIVSAWADRAQNPLPPILVYGDPDVLAARARQLGLTVNIDARACARDHVDASSHGDPANNSHTSDGQSLRVVTLPVAAPVVAGQPNSANAQQVIAAIEMAVRDMARGTVAGLCTAPIAKSVLKASGFAFPGHTEFLGALAKTHWPDIVVSHPEMMLACDDLRVVPMTIHVPLRDVPALVTPSRLDETIRTVTEAMRQNFGIARPRIAVAGLNPHAGEDGRIGTEDRDVIAPVIAKYAADGLDITGPHAGDTLFHAEARKSYDVVIAMYHDQALIPIKTIAFDSGVNITLGLPLVRTSPDHGTAFAIAGKGQARATSFIAALRMADQLSATKPRLALSDHDTR